MYLMRTPRGDTKTSPAPAPFAVGSGHERVIAPLLLILSFGGTVGGAFAGALFHQRPIEVHHLVLLIDDR